MLKGYPLHSLLADTPARVYYVIELVYEYPVVDIRAKSDCRRIFPSYDFTLIKLRLQIFGRVLFLLNYAYVSGNLRHCLRGCDRKPRRSTVLVPTNSQLVNAHQDSVGTLWGGSLAASQAYHNISCCKPVK